MNVVEIDIASKSADYAVLGQQKGITTVRKTGTDELGTMTNTSYAVDPSERPLQRKTNMDSESQDNPQV